MKIGMYCPKVLPYSIRAYQENICEHLRNLGVTWLPISQKDKIPHGVDTFWDPTTGGLAPPWKRFQGHRPLVVSEHGAAAFTLKAQEQPGYPARLPLTVLGMMKAKMAWHAFLGNIDSIITVSSFGKHELIKVFGFPDYQVTAIHHGVDHEVFRPWENGEPTSEAYFLHVSQYQPKKNLIRLLHAYSLPNTGPLPKLIAIAPGFRREVPTCVELVAKPLPHDHLANLYRNAQAFVFPSLHETFGMPILEAMACGCPVITSNSTGCAEVAGDAALLVDPRSVEDIAGAMQKLATDPGLRERLRAKGLERAAQFTWRRSAEQHLAVFEKVVRDWKDGVSARRS